MPLMAGRDDSQIAEDPAWPSGVPLRLQAVRVVRRQFEILRGIDLTFEPDRRYVIVGPSGAGKSTLLRLLIRLDDPTSGSIFLGDRPLDDLPVSTVRRGIGMVFQNARPLPGSVAENLTYPFLVRGYPTPNEQVLQSALQEVGLEPTWLERDVMALSGGERQRLAVAVALMARPEILLLDEPTSALDPPAARLLTAALASRPQRTIAICHHREQAVWLGETAVWMEAGRVLDVGPIAEILRTHDVDALRSPIATEPIVG